MSSGNVGGVGARRSRKPRMHRKLVEGENEKTRKTRGP